MDRPALISMVVSEVKKFAIKHNTGFEFWLLNDFIDSERHLELIKPLKDLSDTSVLAFDATSAPCCVHSEEDMYARPENRHIRLTMAKADLFLNVDAIYALALDVKFVAQLADAFPPTSKWHISQCGTKVYLDTNYPAIHAKYLN